MICPLHAISEKPIVLGKIEKGMVNNLHFLQGVMNIGRSSPVGIINRMFEELFSDHSEDLQNSICIIDAPPGVSCPVVASLQSADLVILVAEPTPFVLVDADVDASNLELVIPPIKKNRHPFFGGKSAVIDQALCTHCEHCKAVCRFHAVKASGDVPVTYSIDPMKCEGCAVCVLQCSSNAIQLDPQQDGFWFESACIYGTFYHAHLFPGHSNSGKLVSAIISAARQTAHQDPQTIILVDGSPGIGCPVIAACNQSDLSVIVTEPTLSGIHDFERIVDTTLHFKIPTFMIINKADLDKKNASRILKLSRNLGVQFLGSIPFDSQFTQAMLMAESITIYDPCSPSSLAVTEILHFLEQLIF